MKHRHFLSFGISLSQKYSLWSHSNMSVFELNIQFCHHLWTYFYKKVIWMYVIQTTAYWKWRIFIYLNTSQILRHSKTQKLIRNCLIFSSSLKIVSITPCLTKFRSEYSFQITNPIFSNQTFRASLRWKIAWNSIP